MTLVFTVDVDNDGVEKDERTSLTWNSISQIPSIRDIYSNHGACLTWFVRADNQLHEVYGTAAHLLLRHADLWREVEAQGDELAWHPHLYRWSRSQARYVNERDPATCVERLTAIDEELRQEGFVFSSVRIGEAFHCNETMAAVERLGMRVDSTAIPGRKRDDHSRVFDWSVTPNAPYFPARCDYRIPGTPTLEILEVPMTTVPLQAPYDSAPLPRYVNPAYRHMAFKTMVDRYLTADVNVDTVLVTILHPDEVVPRAEEHPLYGFSLDDLRRNLAYLFESLERRGIEYRILRMKDLRGSDPSHVENGQSTLTR